jgi:hypothetical protein
MDFFPPLHPHDLINHEIYENVHQSLDQATLRAKTTQIPTSKNARYFLDLVKSEGY